MQKFYLGNNLIKKSFLGDTDVTIPIPPPPAPPPIPFDGLTIWLDAGNTESYPGSGTTWTDLSGNGNDFDWVSSPTYTSSGSMSYFTTLGNRCEGPPGDSVGITNSSGFTIFLVFQQNSLQSTAAFEFYTTNGRTSDLASRGILSHCTWVDNIIYFDQGGCCTADKRTSVASGGVSTWTVVALRRLGDGSERTIWKNGSVLTTNTVTAANLNLGSSSIDLGATVQYGGDSGTWDAYLNSFLVYNTALSDTDLQEVSSYFETRFGI